MSDKYYCDECHAIVDPAQHARSINIKPASGHPDAVGVDSGLYAAICAEQREKDAQKIAKHLGGMVATHIWLSLDSLLMDIREGKEE